LSDGEVDKQFLIVRLDGRDFHILVQEIKVERPFDLRFALNLVEASEAIFQGSPKPVFAYAISDEVIFVILAESSPDWSDENVPILAKRFSNAFYEIIKYPIKEDFPCFDWEVFQTNQVGVLSYLRERQDWAYENFLRAYAFWVKVDSDQTPAQARSSLRGLGPSDLTDLLDRARIDLESIPVWQHRGIVVRSRDILSKEEQFDSSYLDIDLDVPRFETGLGQEYLLNQLRGVDTSFKGTPLNASG